MENENFNCCELFAGCGGLGLGFHKENFNIICCNELEEEIAKTYRKNFKTTNIIVGDITNDKIKKKYIKILRKQNVMLFWVDLLVSHIRCQVIEIQEIHEDNYLMIM